MDSYLTIIYSMILVSVHKISTGKNLCCLYSFQYHNWLIKTFCVSLLSEHVPLKDVSMKLRIVLMISNFVRIIMTIMQDAAASC